MSKLSPEMGPEADNQLVTVADAQTYNDELGKVNA
jgi:hypothetical protein